LRSAYRLESIALNQVGVFDDVRLDFPSIASSEKDADKAELYLFTGPNGCGKSTLLYALAEIFEVFDHVGLIHRRFRGQESGVDFVFAGQVGHYCVRKPDLQPDGWLGNQFGIYSELFNSPFNDLFFGYGLGWNYDYGSDMNDDLAKYKRTNQPPKPNDIQRQIVFPFAAFAYSGQRTLRDIQPPSIQQINNSPFEAALSFDGSARPQVLLQWIANNRAQSALAKADGDASAAEIYDQALARITTLIRDICDLDLEFRLERSPLAVIARLNGESIHFDVLPDGLKSIISWVADLSLRLEAIPWKESGDVFSQPVILFLDEVDIHLHPKWQRRILPAIQKLLPNGQIFVSTHSPFVVGSVEDAWVYSLPEGGHTSGIIKAMPSGAGKSYRLILEETFGIEGEFDVETEALFAAFYRMREQFLKQPTQPDNLLQAARQLAERGNEAALIVGSELRQISRITGLELHLA